MLIALFLISDAFLFLLLQRWEADPLCDGRFPKNYDECKKNLYNIRKNRYGRAPTNGNEVIAEFKKEFICNHLGYSLAKNPAPFFNDVIVENGFENCFFSSANSIELVLSNIPESQRFFIVDGTFQITPKGVWQQVLMLHINFGVKVSQIHSFNRHGTCRFYCGQNGLSRK